MKFVKEYSSDKKQPRIIEISSIEGLIKLLNQSKCYLILKDCIPDEMEGEGSEYSIEVYDGYRE